MSCLSFVSRFLELGDGHRLHVMNIRGSEVGLPVLMVHGMVENGRIFYSEKGHGLGSYLAEQGYDVYVVDLRGQGLSTPTIARGSEHGQTLTIRDDLPKLFDYVLEQSQADHLHLVAHSWGGVYLNSAMLRHPALVDKVIAAAYFGSKRSIRVWNMDRVISIEAVWNRLSPMLARLLGYVPARQMKFGSDNETRQTVHDCIDWIRSDDWVDTVDGFDYGAQVKTVALPATWYIAASNDMSLGNPEDVKRFMQQSGVGVSLYTVLSRQAGNALDYDHVNMLTAAEAREDHFPEVVSWLKSFELRPAKVA